MTVIYERFKVSQCNSYDWILNEKLISTMGDSPISPWYHVNDEEIKWLNDKNLNLLLFARRQDCDDIACFEILNDRINSIYVVEGWQGNGYEVINIYDNIWSWLKSVIDDLSFLAQQPPT